MFANVTLQDILSTLQAPPPEMQAAPGFAQLLQYSESDWAAWLDKLRQLDRQGQAPAGHAAEFLLLPASGIDRAAVEGMQFLKLPDSPALASLVEEEDASPTAMQMLAALLYQPETGTQAENPRSAAETAATVPLFSSAVDGEAGVSGLAADSESLPWTRPVTGSGPILLAGQLWAGSAHAVEPSPVFEPEGPSVQDVTTEAVFQLRTTTPGTAAPERFVAPPPVVQPQSPDFAQQMQQQLQFMINRDLKQMEVQLDPPELGAMKIHLRVDNGLAQVQIVTATAEARDLLDASQQRLREWLPSQVQAQLQLDVRHQPRQQWGDGPGQGQGGTHDAGDVQAGKDDAQPRSGHAGWGRAHVPQGLVDTFV